MSPFLRQRLGVLVATTPHDDLLVLKGLLEAGTLTPVVDRTYGLSEAAAAVRHLREGHPRGKVVLSI